MIFPQAKHVLWVSLGWGLLGCAIPEPPPTSSIPLQGDCGDMSCESLWRSLQAEWSEVFAQLPEECPDTESYGLDVWEYDGQRNVSLICWQPTEIDSEIDPETDATTETKTRYGYFFRIFPYPGTEENFLAPLECYGDEKTCETTWQAIATAYPERLRETQQTCAFRQGFLLQQPQDNASEIAVTCGFFAPSIQIDDDGDGLSDGEGKPTGVDIPLGTFLLPEDNPAP